MTGNDFLVLANQLATGPTEAEWRTAASRAYYATFHVARELLEDLGFTVPQSDRAHSYLWLRLCNSGDAQVIQAGSNFNDLRRHRNHADYDLRRPFRQTVGAQQTLRAAQVIQTLANLTPAQRTQITDTMKIYERDVLQNVTWHP